MVSITKVLLLNGLICFVFPLGQQATVNLVQLWIAPQRHAHRRQHDLAQQGQCLQCGQNINGHKNNSKFHETEYFEGCGSFTDYVQ